MTFYFRQIFLYGHIFVPQNDLELVAAFYIASVILSLICAAAFVREFPKTANLLLTNGVLGMIAIVWAIS